MNLNKALSVIFSIVILSGCAVGNDPTFHYTRTISIGQELIDLQKAKDSNAITDEEFEKAKKELLDNVSMPVNIEHVVKQLLRK